MRFEWQLSWAYWRGRRALRGGSGFISFIALLSVLGIALGVAALVTVLSVMNGFQKEVRNRMLSVVSHLEVRRVAQLPTDDAAMRAHIFTHPAVRGIAPYEPMQVLVMREEILRGALVRGIDPAQEGKVSTMFAALPETLRRSLEPGRWRVLLGRELARSVGVIPGDRIVFMAPDLGDHGAGFMPRLRQFEVAGVFESGHFEYDSTLALIHIEDALRLNRQDSPTHWRILTADPMQVRQTAAALAGRLDEGYQLRDWSQENRVWFEAVQVEKRMMFIILTLIVAVASFNLVSMLVMTVVDKRSDIAILRSMGASRASIMRIFMFQGFASGSLGTLLGLVLGMALVASLDTVLRQLEQLFEFEVLPKGVYLLQRIPTDMHAADLVQVGLIALVLAFLATLYPSWRAARSRPADALRHA
jgi:lipoprotein-releasing system permease protein